MQSVHRGSGTERLAWIQLRRAAGRHHNNNVYMKTRETGLLIKLDL